MEIIEITRSVSKTVQEEPFQPLSVFASYKATVGEEDDLAEVSQELHELADADVRKITDMFTKKQEQIRKAKAEALKNIAPF